VIREKETVMGSMRDIGHHSEEFSAAGVNFLEGTMEDPPSGKMMEERRK
jgi:hypothetical protein